MSKANRSLKRTDQNTKLLAAYYSSEFKVQKNKERKCKFFSNTIDSTLQGISHILIERCYCFD